MISTLVCLALCAPVLGLADAAAQTLYHNPDGGQYAHADANCLSVSADYLPMEPVDPSDPASAGLMLCPYCTGGDAAQTPAYVPMGEVVPEPETLRVDDDEAALTFAKAFFASPYVSEALNGYALTVARAGELWRVTAAAQGGELPALTLDFDATGRVAQYSNGAYALPILGSFTLDPSSGDLDFIQKLDSMRLSLFPSVEYNQGGIYLRDEAKGLAYCALDDFSTWVILLGEQKLVGLGDFDMNARYLDYLTRDEAIEKARAALAAKDPGTAHTQLVQARFIMLEDRYRGEGEVMPQWEVVLGERADGSGAQTMLVIDATTGEVLGAAEEYGNG